MKYLILIIVKVIIVFLNLHLVEYYTEWDILGLGSTFYERKKGGLFSSY